MKRMEKMCLMPVENEPSTFHAIQFIQRSTTSFMIQLQKAVGLQFHSQNHRMVEAGRNLGFHLAQPLLK